jgi:uncharacterized membrane protein
MGNQTSAPAICRACQDIDRADGVEDGRLHPVLAKRIRHETAVVRKIRSEQNRLTDAITNFAGSMSFVYVHTVWFGVWVMINLGLLGASLAFDRFPFGLLTMIVSLEAIFLATFVMISQNRQAARADVRSQVDFENNVRGEIWAVHIGHALGIDGDHVERTVMATIKGLREMEQL